MYTGRVILSCALSIRDCMMVIQHSPLEPPLWQSVKQEQHYYHVVPANIKCFYSQASSSPQNHLLFSLSTKTFSQLISLPY